MALPTTIKIADSVIIGDGSEGGGRAGEEDSKKRGKMREGLIEGSSSCRRVV